jgi:hypothetical protein
LVISQAAAGDQVAADCVAWAGRALADLALGVIRQLDLQAQVFETVLIGSLYQAGPLLIEPMRAALATEAPRARLVRLTAPPVVGGVVLAWQATGLETAAARERLTATVPGMRRP